MSGSKKNNLDHFWSIVVFENSTGYWNKPNEFTEFLLKPNKVRVCS